MTITDDTQVSTGTTFSISGPELTAALSTIIPFAAPARENLPALSAVYVQPHEGGVRFTATNRHVLGEYAVPADRLDGLADGGAFLLPLDAAKDWLKVAKAHRLNAPEFTVAVEGDMVTLSSFDGVSSTRIVDAQYPQVDRLFSDESGGTATVGFGTAVLSVLVKAFPKQPLAFTFSAKGNTGPVAVKAPHMPEFRGIVMPLRLSD